MTKTNHGEVPKEGPWVGLPVELLELVITRLNLGDRIQLSRVCKIWRVIVCMAKKPNGTPYGSPCFLRLEENNCICTMIDPLRKEKFSIDAPSLPPAAEVVASKQNWLLFVNYSYYITVFFFHPLSKAIVNLPNIKFYIPDYYTFSAPPTSGDCIVVAHYAYKGYCPISYWRRGDHSWRELEFREGRSFSRASAMPVISKGKMYCLGRDGSVGVFDLVGETWNIIVEPSHQIPDVRGIYLASFDDELLSVLVDPDEESAVHIFKLDVDSQKPWVELQNLGGRWFFAATAASMCLAATVEGAGDRIYFPMMYEEEFVYYSSATSEFHPKISFDCAQVLEENRGAWIEPALEKFSYEELQWKEDEDDYCYSLRDLFQCQVV